MFILVLIIANPLIPVNVLIDSYFLNSDKKCGFDNKKVFWANVQKSTVYRD